MPTRHGSHFHSGNKTPGRYIPENAVIFDTETTDLLKGYKRGKPQAPWLSQIAYRQGGDDTLSKVMSYHTDILKPLVEKHQRGEISPSQLVEAAIAGRGGPKWGEDIRHKDSVLNKVFSEHLRVTHGELQGRKLPGSNLVSTREAVQDFIGRLKRGDTYAAWNIDFDLQIMGHAARRTGLGQAFNEAVKQAGGNLDKIESASRIKDLSLTSKLFLYEESRRNALIEHTQANIQKSRAQLVHLGDVEQWSNLHNYPTQEAYEGFLERLANKGPLTPSELAKLREKHAGFHSYFDQTELAMQNFRRYQEWNIEHGQDFGNDLAEESFARGRRNPNIRYVKGHSVEIMAQTLGYDLNRDLRLAHEGGFDTWIEKRVNDVFEEYNIAVQEAQVQHYGRFYGVASAEQSLQRELAVLETARERFNEKLQRLQKAGKLGPQLSPGMIKGPVTIDMLLERHERFTLDNIRDRAALHAREALGLTSTTVDEEIEDILRPKFLREGVVDSYKRAGERSLRLSASRGQNIFVDAWREVQPGLKKAWDTKAGKIFAGIAGLAVLDSFLPERDPPAYRAPREHPPRDPRQPPVGDAFHSWVANKAILEGWAQRSEYPVPDSSFHTEPGEGAGTGYIDLLSNRHGPIEVKSALKGNVAYHGAPSEDQIAQTQNYINALGLPTGYLFHINPADPSNITINQIMAGRGRSYQSDFVRPLPGLRAAGSAWSAYGGIQRGGGDFRSGFSAIRAFARTHKRSFHPTLIGFEDLAYQLEKSGQNAFSLGATGAYEATHLTWPKSISAKEVVWRPVARGVENRTVLAGLTDQMSEMGRNLQAIPTPQPIAPAKKIYPLASTGIIIQGNMRMRNRPFYAGPNLNTIAEDELRPLLKDFRDKARPPVGGLSARSSQWTDQFDELVPLRPFQRRPGEVVAIKPRPGWPASSGDFRLLEWSFHRYASAAPPGQSFQEGHWVLRYAREKLPEVPQPQVTDSGLKGKAYQKLDPQGREQFNIIQKRRKFKAQFQGQLIDSEFGVMGWHRLPAPIRQEAQRAGFNEATWNIAVKNSVISQNAYELVHSDNWPTDDETLQRVLSGEPNEVASKVGTELTQQGEIRNAHIVLGKIGNEVGPLSPKEFVRAIGPGGKLSVLQKDASTLTVNLANPQSLVKAGLTVETRSIVAQMYLRSLKGQGLSDRKARHLLKQIGFLTPDIAGNIDEIPQKVINKARGYKEPAKRAFEPIKRMWEKIQSMGTYAQKVLNRKQKTYARVLGEVHTKNPHQSLHLRGRMTMGRAFYGGTMETLHGDRWRGRHLLAAAGEEVSEQTGMRIQTVFEAERPEKGFRAWLWDKGSRWASKGTGPLAAIGRATKHVAGAQHLGATGIMYGLSLFHAWQYANTYKSHMVGFGIETAKVGVSMAVYDTIKEAVGATIQKTVKIPFLDHIAALVGSMVFDNVLHPITEMISSALGLKKEIPPNQLPSNQYMYGISGMDDQTHLAGHGINPSFGTNTSGFGSGWRPPARVIVPPATVVPRRPRLNLRANKTAGLSQKLWKLRRSSHKIRQGAASRSGHTPPPMINMGAIAA